MTWEPLIFGFDFEEIAIDVGSVRLNVIASPLAARRQDTHIDVQFPLSAEKEKDMAIALLGILETEADELDLDLQIIASEEFPMVTASETSGTGSAGGATADCPPPTVVGCTSGNTAGFASMCNTCCA